MRNLKAFSFLTKISLALMLLFVMASCEEDPCEDAVCAACPSSRVLIQYEDSTGMCPAAFHAGATIQGIDMTSWDTTLNYNFSDSCQAGLLVRENYRYIVRSGGYMDMIDILSFTYQDPISVTECCLCYPAASVTLSIDGDTTVIDYPAGQYDNTPYTIAIN